MTAKILLDKLYYSVVNLDKNNSFELISKCIEEEISSEMILQTMAKSMFEVRDKYESREYYLPQLIIASNILKVSNKILLKKGNESDVSKVGKVVIGTIEGDIHDIGKNIVSVMLNISGFEIHDLGKDVSASTFIGTAIEDDANIIACSALMSTTMPFFNDVVKLRNDMGLANKFKIMVGGAPVTQEYCDKIGANGYAKDANESIKIAQKLMYKADNL
jgi:dimethylamine corrinoid protein